MCQCDGGLRTGGGVLIAVSRAIRSISIRVACELDLIWVCLSVNNNNIVFGVCYEPPSSRATFVSALHDGLNTVSRR